MIYFFADDHYNVHPGKVIFEHLPDDRKSGIRFFENDWTVLESASWLNDCELLILNLIGTTCNLPHPGPGAEKAVRQWCEKGGNILMLHGSSAAFWQWEWWRSIVGFRWVRPNDPDGVEHSTHPNKPYRLTVSKTRHVLTKSLEEIELPADEIYINMEQVKRIEKNTGQRRDKMVVMSDGTSIPLSRNREDEVRELFWNGKSKAGRHRGGIFYG